MNEQINEKINDSLSIVDKSLTLCGSVNTFPAHDMTNILLDIRVLLQMIKDEALKEIGKKNES